MIAYEIQLRYVILGKIQSETKSSPRQNSVREKNQRKSFFCQKKNYQKKKLSRTNRCLLSLSGKYIPQ